MAIRNSLEVNDSATTASAVTSFTSTTSAVLLAANQNRVGATVFNEGPTGILHILFGAGTASTTNYAVQVAAGGYWECPYRYTGQLTAIFASAGTARVQELT